MRGFEFQRLRVFDAAARAAQEVDRLARKIPLYHRALRDQLMRAVISVVLNIAEGADEYSPREKVRFYRMARRSAAESAAALELLIRFGAITRSDAAQALELLNHVAAMLSNMMRRTESDDFRSPHPQVGAGPGAGAGPQFPVVGAGPGAGAGPQFPNSDKR